MEIQAVSSLKNVSPSAWNSLRQGNFPFSRHEHLTALEATQCLGERTGWLPHYVLVFDRVSDEENSETHRAQSKVLRAATWFYEKTNSYGEFVFDHEWADLHDRLGLPYFPKSVTAIPFTPASGQKLLTTGTDSTAMKQVLLEAVKKTSRRFGHSSHHHLFIPGSEKQIHLDAGFALRTGVQFHWRNQNYHHFDDFLSALKKKRRKEIRYERRGVDSDILIKELSGSDLSSFWADFAYTLYQKTNIEKMSFVCLTRNYFHEIFDKLRNYIRFFVAVKKGTLEPIAGALFFFEGNAMFGRYWGSLEERKFLHFELCYYAPIETAIAGKIALFEAGAQGSHKISRGFLPTFTYSAHQFFHTQIHDAFLKFCSHEEKQIFTGIDNYSDHFPFLLDNPLTDAGLPVS